MPGPRENGGFPLASRPAGGYHVRMKAQAGTILFACVVGLLGAGCGLSAPSTPLHSAVEDGDYPAVRRHIAARSDLNAKDSSGWTPLHRAAMRGDLPMVQLLADAGADPKRTGPQGKTILAVAREQGHTSVVEYLEARLAQKTEPAGGQPRGRALIDGGVGVSEVLDGF